jgi:hypothetical protein
MTIETFFTNFGHLADTPYAFQGAGLGVLLGTFIEIGGKKFPIGDSETSMLSDETDRMMEKLSRVRG